MSLVRGLANALVSLAGAPATPANGATQFSAGYEGEILATQAHGKMYERNRAGQLFTITTTLAGVTVPVIASNMVGTFSFLNPANSGVRLELWRLKIAAFNSATQVLGNLALAYQLAPAALTSPTLIAPTSNRIGSGLTDATTQGYSAGTYTGTPVLIGTLGVGYGATTELGDNTTIIDFDGEYLIEPNVAVALVASVAQTEALSVTLTYARVPK